MPPAGPNLDPTQKPGQDPASGGPGKPGKPGNEAEEQDLRKHVSRLLLWQCGLLLCTILAIDLLLPWKLLAAPFAVGVVVVGLLAWKRAGRLKKPGFLRFMLGAGLALGTFVAVTSLMPLVFWEASSAYDECLRQALTIKSEAVCEAEFTKTMQDIGGGFGG